MVSVGFDRNRKRDNLKEDVLIIQEFNHILADGVPERSLPIFVGAVCCNKEQQVNMVFAEQQGVPVKQAVLKLDIRGNIPLGPDKFGLVTVKVSAFDFRADEEVGRDIVTLRYVIAIAQLVERAFPFQVDVLDVVLDSVLGVGELFVEWNAPYLMAVSVILAVTDIINLRFGVYE